MGSCCIYCLQFVYFFLLKICQISFHEYKFSSRKLGSMDPQGNPWMDFRSSQTLKFYVHAHVCIFQGSQHSTDLRRFYCSHKCINKNTQPCVQAFFVLAALKSQLIFRHHCCFAIVIYQSNDDFYEITFQMLSIFKCRNSL